MGVLKYGNSELLNCSCNYADGETLVEGKDIIILANDGYEFEKSFINEDGDFKYYNYVLIGGYEESMSHSPNKLTYRVTNFNVNKDITLLVTNPIYSGGEIEQLGNFINLYNPTNEELTELAKKRFVTGIDNVVDYGQFITSLYVLPLKLDSELLNEVKKDIILGTLNSMVKSTIINNYLFELNGGSIVIPNKYNNIYDFINTECILHIPFLDKIYLNSEYVIGQTLNIDMYVDLYSSNLTVNVTSTFNNKIIASAKGVIGMNIPFMQKSNNSVSNSLSNIYKNNIDRCFIEVNRNIPYIKNNNIFGGSVVEYGKIGNYAGYLESDKIVLETSATNQEQEEIKNLLRNGVFI